MRHKILAYTVCNFASSGKTHFKSASRHFFLLYIVCCSLSRSAIVIHAFRACLQCGCLSCQDRSCFEAWKTEMGSGEGQSIRKILRAISQCRNYQCHQLVCNNFFPASWDRPTPSVRVRMCVNASVITSCYCTCSQLLYLIGYMQIGPKLKATCKGIPHGTVLKIHKATHTYLYHPTSATALTFNCPSST